MYVRQRDHIGPNDSSEPYNWNHNPETLNDASALGTSPLPPPKPTIIGRFLATNCGRDKNRNDVIHSRDKKNMTFAFYPKISDQYKSIGLMQPKGQSI
ncbi:hypothetical protein BLOT_003743 [Blomia tropicalis]|nr:hypothetical protein BLOT_003743 [Blomia tropicalis]